MFLSLAICGKSFAQDSALLNKPLRWDLAKCIDYAKSNNIQVNTLRLNKQTAQQEYSLARAGKEPNLAATASQDFTHRPKQQNAAAGSIGSAFSASGQYALTSAVTLYNGNYISNNIRQKNIELEQATLGIVQQENDITLQVTQAYLLVLLDKENIISDTSVVNTSNAHVKLEQQRFDAGAAARKDLIQLQAQNAGDKYTLAVAINTERADLLTLKQLLILPTATDFDIVKPEVITEKMVLTPLREVEDTAFKNRPEIKSGQLAIDAAQLGVKIARSGYLPTLTAGGAIGTQYATGIGYFSQLNNNLYQQLGLTLSIPILTRRIVKTQVEEAKINADQATLNFSNIKITLSQEVERAYINILNAQSQYHAADVQYKFNQESYRIANEQLRIGAISIVDLMVQTTSFMQAQQAFLQAKYNLLLTQKIYDFYRGVPVTL